MMTAFNLYAVHQVIKADRALEVIVIEMSRLLFDEMSHLKNLALKWIKAFDSL